MKFGLYLWIIVFAALPFFAGGKEKIYFKIGSQESLEAEGVKFKGMKDTPANPLPPPQAVMFSRKNTGEKIDFYNMYDLWRRDQIIGVWRGEAGTIYLARISLPLPEMEALEGTYIPKHFYDQWKNEAKPFVPQNNEEIKNWLSQLFELKSISDPELLPSKSSPSNCQTFAFKGESGGNNPGTHFIYVLEPKTQPGAKFAVSYECRETPDGDIQKSEKAIASSLISFTFSQPKKKTENKPPAISGGTEKTARSTEYIASREEVIKNIQNAKDWDYTETENFILVHNVKNKKTVKDIGESLERSRKVFQSFYPLKIEIKAVSVCRFFQNREDYKRYVGEKYEWTGGLWVAGRKELVVSPMDWGSQSKIREMMVEVTYHEGFHQYLHYAVNEVNSSIWFNEGNATFFEGIDFKAGDKFEIIATDRLNAVKKSPDSLIPPKRLISMEHEEFVSGNINANYTSVWALMFFLHKGSYVLKEKNNYGQIPYRYYDALIESGDWKKANEEAWKDINMEQFEKDFKNFWHDNSLIKKAEKFNPLQTGKK